MVSYSMVAGVVTLGLLWSFNLGVVYFRENREIRIRGPWETVEVAFFVAGLASFGMLNTIDEPFIPCFGYMLWGLVPMVFVWPAFYLYIIRYARLYHLNRMRSKSSNSSSKSDGVVTVEGEIYFPKTTCWSRCCDGAVSFSARITEKKNINLLVRLWLACFFILASCLLAVYSTHMNDRVVPASWEDCREHYPMWYVCFSVMLLEGGFFLFLLFGTIIDIGREASKRGDSLGIRTMLRRMGLDAFLSMICFLVLVLLHFLDHIEGRWIFISFVPFIITFYIDLTFIPTMRALVNMRRANRIARQNGILDQDHLSQVLKISECKTPAELARVQNLIRLQAFLMTKDGYRSMHEHLAMEFGLESLLFVTEAVKYAADFSHFDEDDDISEAASEDERSLLTKQASKTSRGVPPSDIDEDEQSYGPASSVLESEDDDETQTTVSTNEGNTPVVKIPKRKRNKKVALSSAMVPKSSVTGHTLQKKLRNQFRGKRRENAKKYTYEDMASRCIKIYTKFVHNNAPYQINIPASMLSRFRGIGFVTRNLKAERASLADIETGSTTSSQVVEFEATPTIFNDLVMEVLAMVYRDSFQRYLVRKHNRELWEKFDATSTQMDMLTENSSQYTSQASSGTD